MKPPESNINLPDFKTRPDAIALDIDGTLLDSKSRLSVRNSLAIKDCLSAGIPVIIATSRPARSVRRLLGTEIMKTCSLVMQNGAIGIGRPPLKGRIKEKIDSETASELISLVTGVEPKIRITVELDGEVFGTNNPRDPISLWEVNSATPEMQVSLEEALKGEPAKFAMGLEHKKMHHIAGAIESRFPGYFSIVGEGTFTFLNITRKSATKSNTLQRLLASRKITLENVVAVGDDLPDFDMLSACGISIAMGNAVEAIKSICKYTTATNNEDGVAVVLEKILEGVSG